MERKAAAVWEGTLKDGKGRVSTESGALKDAPYSFKTRFEEERGSNPEELIAAAHAACFSMAFTAELVKARLPVERVETTAVARLENAEGKWTVTEVRLRSAVRVKADPKAVEAAAETAKRECPISRLLNACVTLELKIE